MAAATTHLQERVILRLLCELASRRNGTGTGTGTGGNADRGNRRSGTLWLPPVNVHLHGQIRLK
jgi:hypothetical protein